jgi:hypothetical protein
MPRLPLGRPGSAIPPLADHVKELIKAGVSSEALQTKYHLTADAVKALTTQIEVEKKIIDLAAGATIGLGSANERLGRIDNETIPLLRVRAEVLDAIRKIEQQPAGVINESALREAGVKTDLETIGRLKAGLKEARDLGVALGTALDEVAGSSDNLFGHIIRGIERSIPLWIDLLTRILTVNAALLATDVLKGIAVGVGVALAFAEKGGVVTASGIQHFAGGGNVLPIPRGRDTVPAMLAPGEMVLTQHQQANLFKSLEAGMIQRPSIGDMAPVTQDNRVMIDARGGFNDTHGLQRLALQLQTKGKFWTHVREKTFSQARQGMDLPV